MKKFIFKIVFYFIVIQYVVKCYNTQYLIKDRLKNCKNQYLKKVYRFILKKY